MRKIGVIGGSGLYKIEGIDVKEEIVVSTPFGEPSDKIISGQIEGKDIAFLPRHGRNHTINPSEINYRANIYAMKKLGVDTLVSVCACGSLKEELKPLDFVLPTQFLDRTNQARKYTFFEDGAVAHVSFSHPVCECTAKVMQFASRDVDAYIHCGGTYLNMEGPQFSTLAESQLYRSWGMDIIGMTSIAEARLAREAEMCFVSLAAVTDYDCWHPDHDSVTVEGILKVLKKNVENSKSIIKNFVRSITDEKNCKCSQALQFAIVTNPAAISSKTKKKLECIIGKYMK
jgi:5'-methylthioadenosine phosphorylase